MVSNWKKYQFFVITLIITTVTTLTVGWVKDVTNTANDSAKKSYVDQELRKKADIIDVTERCKELDRKIEKKADSNVLTLILQNLSDIKQEQQSLNNYIRTHQ